METIEAIESRRNVRSFTDQAISPENLNTILEAGRRVLASNIQPWDFVLVTDRDRLVELATTWRGASHIATSAATIVLVAPVAQDEHLKLLTEYDLGQATMSMMLAATALEIGSAHASIGERATAGALLSVPEDHVCMYFIALGYPADRPIRPIINPKRRAFEDVVHQDKW